MFTSECGLEVEVYGVHAAWFDLFREFRTWKGLGAAECLIRRSFVQRQITLFGVGMASVRMWKV
jgi:hypothetical protein